MDEEKRTCKTCNSFRGHANYCVDHDSPQAEWDTCQDHENYDELLARVGTQKKEVPEDITEEEARIYAALMAARYQPSRPLLEILEECQTSGEKTQ